MRARGSRVLAALADSGGGRGGTHAVGPGPRSQEGRYSPGTCNFPRARRVIPAELTFWNSLITHFAGTRASAAASAPGLYLFGLFVSIPRWPAALLLRQESRAGDTNWCQSISIEESRIDGIIRE